MPIIDSEVWKVRNRGNGRLAVFEKHTDHNGKVHEHRYGAPVGHDVATSLAAWIPKLEAQLIASEKEGVQSAVQEGADPSALELKHLTTAQKAKRVIKALMLGSPYKMIKAAQYVQGFSDGQILSHFTSEQLTRIRARQNHILDNVAIFEADTREEL